MRFSDRRAVESSYLATGEQTRMVPVTDYRQCSRPGCGSRAIATLRYNYAARTATVNPLESGDDPHSWDLCDRHLSRLTVPEGWDLDRTADLFPEEPAALLSTVHSVQSEDDFTDEEMQALAAALEESDVADQLAPAHRQPVSRVVRRTDIPQPSGHHPSRRNLPGRAPQRHLRAVHGDGE